jgi:hypothetical protein
LPKERRVLRPKSHRRYAEACNRTALLPHYGFGKLQSKAAPSAQSNLGILYLFGQGVAQDDTEGSNVISEGCRPRRRRRRISTWEPIRKRKAYCRTIVRRCSGFTGLPSKATPSPSSISGDVRRKPRRAAGLCSCPMWISLSAAQGEKSCQDSRNGRAEDDPSSDKRSAEARTRLEASYAANSSLKECALRPVPQLAIGDRRAVSSAWNRCGTVGQIGS